MKRFKSILFFFTLIGCSHLKPVALYEKGFDFVKLRKMPVKNGNNGNQNYYFLESTFQWQKNINSKKNKYYILNPKGEIIDLNYEIRNPLLSRIYYYEIQNETIFILESKLSSRDWISIKLFDLKSGNLITDFGGEVACENKNNNDFNWKVGNENCDWINYNTKEIAFGSDRILDSKIINKRKVYLADYGIFVYNWKYNTTKTIKIFNIAQVDAITGGNLGMKNIKYNSDKMEFNYK